MPDLTLDAEECEAECKVQRLLEGHKCRVFCDPFVKGLWCVERMQWDIDEWCWWRLAAAPTKQAALIAAAKIVLGVE